jgi:hypothetical protein
MPSYWQESWIAMSKSSQGYARPNGYDFHRKTSLLLLTRCRKGGMLSNATEDLPNKPRTKPAKGSSM